MDMAQHDVDMRSALSWHLSANHYPPVPNNMIEPCIEAIDAGWSQDWEREIPLPEGILYKGNTWAPAYEIIEQHHLEFWLPEEED
jgi:hypothetical protein